MSIEKICTENGIPSTNVQLDSFKKIRSKIEHQFWKTGINKILEGFTESDFEDYFLKFILELDYSNITEADRKVITSSTLKYHTLSKRAQEFLLDWIKRNEK